MRLSVATFVLGLAACIACSAATFDSGSQPFAAGAGNPRRHLKNFKSKGELARFLADLERRHRNRRTANGYGLGSGSGSGSLTGGFAVSQAVTVTVSAGAGGGGREEEESITNVQTTGVDEGSIVKVRGNYLVVLRRGRLFTIDIGRENFKPVSAIDAYDPDIDPKGTWYDEMLISGNNVAVIGYSYDRGGTEIGLFKLDSEGRLSYHSTYHLRSNDYYSSRNYSSRLIGNRLIFYSPLNVDFDDGKPIDSFPALRRWHKGASDKDFRPIAPATNIYIPSEYRVEPDDTTLHTVTTCEIGDDLACTAQSVIGPSGNVFYTSPKHVYVWASSWDSDDDDGKANRSLLFKMPLLGGDPSAVRVSGGPVDQLSFHEDGDKLNVLVRAESKGDGMWKSEVAKGEVALLQLDAQAFGDGSSAAPRSSYQKLEEPSGYSLQNRFIGDYLLYGSESYSEKDAEATRTLFVVNRKTKAFFKLQLSHDVQRLDRLGNDGIVVGNAGQDLTFTSIDLEVSPTLIHSQTVPRAAQGETRSQGFFYKPLDAATGLLGLPIIRSSTESISGHRAETASVVFMRVSDLRFQTLGELASAQAGSDDDDCRASCVDWYGNARPIFLKNRIFALLGYEIVEGDSSNGQLLERGRTSFAPSRKRKGN